MEGQCYELLVVDVGQSELATWRVPIFAHNRGLDSVNLPNGGGLAETIGDAMICMQVVKSAGCCPSQLAAV